MGRLVVLHGPGEAEDLIGDILDRRVRRNRITMPEDDEARNRVSRLIRTDLSRLRRRRRHPLGLLLLMLAVAIALAVFAFAVPP